MFAASVTLAPAQRAIPVKPRVKHAQAPQGFAADTLIRTITGPRRVRDLMAGDLVLDAKGQIVELRGIRKSRVSAAALVQIDPSALGLGMAPGRLDRPLLVGAGQKLAMDDWRSKVLFGKPALTPARALVDGVHVRCDAARGATLYCLETDQDCVLVADGLQALVKGSV